MEKVLDFSTQEYNGLDVAMCALARSNGIDPADANGYTIVRDENGNTTVKINVLEEV